MHTRLLNMKTITTLSVITLSLLVLQTLSAPVPIPEGNELEEEEGLLLLVPTVSANGKEQPQKREVEYELISIPKEVIRRTVREVTKAHSRSGNPEPLQTDENSITSIFVSDINSPDGGEEILLESFFNLTTAANDTLNVKKTELNEIFNLNDILPSLASHTHKDTKFDEAASGYIGSTASASGSIPVMSNNILSQILKSITTAGIAASNTGAVGFGAAGNAVNTLQAVTQAGSSALLGGTNAVRWILQQKAQGLRKAADFSSNGLQYFGRLTSALLKILLRVPAIKVRVLSEVLQAGQPLVSAVSEVIGNSADDLGEILTSQSSVFRDTIGIIFRLISDVLAIKGRIFAALTGNGFDKIGSFINSGVKVGGAFVQSGGDVASAVGRGVSEIIQVVSDANLPPLPALPILRLPQLTASYGTPAASYGAPKPTYGAPASKESRETGVKQSYT